MLAAYLAFSRVDQIRAEDTELATLDDQPLQVRSRDRSIDTSWVSIAEHYLNELILR
jgi:hypothetical protein